MPNKVLIDEAWEVAGLIEKAIAESNRSSLNLSPRNEKDYKMRNINKKEIQAFFKMREKGMSVTAISKATGRSKSAITKHTSSSPYKKNYSKRIDKAKQEAVSGFAFERFKRDKYEKKSKKIIGTAIFEDYAPEAARVAESQAYHTPTPQEPLPARLCGYGN